jgi:DNA polymerase V
MRLYDRIIDARLLVRRVNIVANRVVLEYEVPQTDEFEQLDLFTDYGEVERKKNEKKRDLEREKRMQHAILDIQKKYGKNAVLKGMNLEEGARTIERNGQIGGHKA